MQGRGVESAYDNTQFLTYSDQVLFAYTIQFFELGYS